MCLWYKMGKLMSMLFSFFPFAFLIVTIHFMAVCNRFTSITDKFCKPCYKAGVSAPVLYLDVLIIVSHNLRLELKNLRSLRTNCTFQQKNPAVGHIKHRAAHFAENATEEQILINWLASECDFAQLNVNGGEQMPREAPGRTHTQSGSPFMSGLKGRVTKFID